MNEERSDDGPFSQIAGGGYGNTGKLLLFVSICMLYSLLIYVPEKKRTATCGCTLLKVRYDFSGHFPSNCLQALS